MWNNPQKLLVTITQTGCNTIEKLLQNLKLVWLIKKISALYDSWRFITEFTTTGQLTLPLTNSIHFTLSYTVSLYHCLNYTILCALTIFRVLKLRFALNFACCRNIYRNTCIAASAFSTTIQLRYFLRLRCTRLLLRVAIHSLIYIWNPYCEESATKLR